MSKKFLYMFKEGQAAFGGDETAMKNILGGKGKGLAELTGDARWAERALLMWANACQCVSDGNARMHGRLRPLGAQNEAYYNCRWHTERAGTLNDWLVAWPGAYRLSAICERARLRQGLGIGT